MKGEQKCMHHQHVHTSVRTKVWRHDVLQLNAVFLHLYAIREHHELE